MGNIILINDFVRKIRCGEEYVVYHWDFEIDVNKLISQSGYYDQFIKKFAKAVRILEGLKHQCVECSSLFEKLKRTEDLYSIRIKGQKNIRILFSFLNYEDSEKAILLVCFEEKGGKDYSDWIPVANNRLMEITERL